MNKREIQTIEKVGKGGEKSRSVLKKNITMQTNWPPKLLSSLHLPHSLLLIRLLLQYRNETSWIHRVQIPVFEASGWINW